MRLYVAALNALVLAAMLLTLHLWHPTIRIITRTNPRDGAVMVWVPAGKFTMGTSSKQDYRKAWRSGGWRELSKAIWGRFHPLMYDPRLEQPAHIVYLDGYWIYRYEVTVRQYRAFCHATGHRMPPIPSWGWQNNHPIINVSWHDAQAYAVWAGAVLPTEAEWEKAARSPDGRIYPWGNNWDHTKCVNGTQNTKPVGSISADTSYYGCRDMAGNVGEWCADWFALTYYKIAPKRNPAGPTTSTGARVVRGYCWNGGGDEYYFRTFMRTPCNPASGSDNIGFRCVVRSPAP